MRSVHALVVLFTLCLATHSAAFQVDIDGVTDTNGDPQQIFMSAGTYEITPIDTSQGGLYDAWQAFSGAWLWVFNVRSSSAAFPDLAFGDGTVYPTAADAFQGSAAGGQFTVTTDELIWFSIGDSFYGDNAGGVSILVTLVPEPGTGALLALGLCALGASSGSRRRRSSIPSAPE